MSLLRTFLARSMEIRARCFSDSVGARQTISSERFFATRRPCGPGLGRRATVLVVLAAMALVVLDGAVANVALPTIARSLHVTAARSVWVITAYQAALVIALLPCAALGESFGHRRVFAIGTALFMGASLLCAASRSLGGLVAARFLQGLGGAAIMALGIALLRLSVSPRELGSAIGWNALVVALSSAAGPAIGAAVLSFTDWPWLFVVNLPVGLGVLSGVRGLPAGGRTGRRLDLASVALNAVAFGALVLGSELIPTRPKGGGVVLAGAGAAWFALVRREMPKEAPLLPLDLLRAAPFRMSVIASVLCFSGVAAGMLVLPFHLQNEFGQSTWTTGLYLMPWPLTVAIVAPLVGELASKVPTAWLGAAGGGLLALGLGAMAMWPAQGRTWPLAPLAMTCGLGFGLFNVSNNRSLFFSASRKRAGAVGGMQGAARLTGQMAGGMLTSLLFTAASVEAAPRMIFGVAAVLTLAAGIMSGWRARWRNETMAT